MTAYHYIVRTMRGTHEIESHLRALSQEGWEPIHFTRGASGEYEVILRREQMEEHAEAVLEHLEATATEFIAPKLSE